MISKTAKKVRLPSAASPERYRIMIKPDLEGFTFEGEETVYLRLAKAVKEITLHAKELEILGGDIKNGKESLEIKKIKYNTKEETAVLKFSKTLKKGNAELSLSFKGLLTDKMRGFYRSKYLHEGKEKYMATTQFEATDARRAFPCFDEPAQKAVFDVTLMIPQELTAISNTIETAVKEHESGLKVVEFAPTPRMSTYLLAFIAGDFEFIEGRTKNGVLVRVFTTPGKKHQGQFALKAAVKSLEFYEEYFGIPYPLPVLDLIAIPDFESAAMENWGAVTYRESALLVDEQHSSTANKQWVAIVVAHELAHQWFGNLVTMRWWTDLWLNEGFASYMEYLAVDSLFPEWNIWTQYVGGRFSHALDLDSLENTHPIEIEVYHPDEIGEIFDDISYAKGSCVIRMLAEYLGPVKFRDGLRYYLKKHSLGNTRTSDLWKSFEKVSGKPVRKIMENWTKKGGYPVVTVTEKPAKLQLVQERFFSSALSRKKGRDRTIWRIPVSLAGSSGPVPKPALMTKKKLELPLPKNAEWLKLNTGQTAFYRTNYPPHMLDALGRPVAAKELPPADRLGILSDAFALAETGQLNTVKALELLNNYKGEDDYTVWSEISSSLFSIDSLLYGRPSHKRFQHFAMEIFSGIATKMGWERQEGEMHTDALLRSLALYGYGHFCDWQTIEKALGMFQAEELPPADLRGVVYRLAAEFGNQPELDKFKARYSAEQLHEEQDRLGRALAFFKEEKLIRQVLEFADSSQVRLQDRPFIIGATMANPAGREIAWRHIEKNWKDYAAEFKHGHLLHRLIYPAAGFTEEKWAKEIRGFFKNNPAPGSARTIRQVLEKISSNASWLKRDEQSVERWLESV